MRLTTNPFSPKSRRLNELENFQAEHQRLLRSLAASLERETELHSELRRMKDSVMTMALRFNTALKVAQEDELIIENLRQEAEECRTEALIAKKQSEAANSLITSLRLEINSLKKKLSDSQIFDQQFHNHRHSNTSSSSSHHHHPTLSRHNTLSSSTYSIHHPSNNNHNSNNSNSSNVTINMSILYDQEVDEMFDRMEEIQIPRGTIDTNQTTSFQKWKIHNFLYTTDTPSGSENHDKHAVEKLEEMVLMQSMEEYHNIPRTRKPTKSSVVKSKEMMSIDLDGSLNYKGKRNQVTFELPSVQNNQDSQNIQNSSSSPFSSSGKIK